MATKRRTNKNHKKDSMLQNISTGIVDFSNSVGRGMNRGVDDIYKLLFDKQAMDFYGMDKDFFTKDSEKFYGDNITNKGGVADVAGNILGQGATFITPGGGAGLFAKGAALTKTAMKGKKISKLISAVRLSSSSATKAMKATKVTKLASKTSKSVSNVGSYTKKFKKSLKLRRLKKPRRVGMKSGGRRGAFSGKKLAMLATAGAMFSNNQGAGTSGRRDVLSGTREGGFLTPGSDIPSGGQINTDSESLNTPNNSILAGSNSKKQLSTVTNPTISIGNRVLKDDMIGCGCNDAQAKIRRKRFRSDVVIALEKIQKSEKIQADALDKANEKVQNEGFGETGSNFIENSIPFMQETAANEASKVSLWSMLGASMAAGLFALYQWWQSGGLGNIFEWVTGFVKDAFETLMKPFYDWWDNDIMSYIQKLGSTINIIVEKISGLLPDFMREKLSSNLNNIGDDYDSLQARSKYADYSGVKQFAADGMVNTSSGVLTKKIPGTSPENSGRVYVGQNQQPWMKRINSEFGNTKNRDSAHRGVDFRASRGTKVTSISSGVVSYYNDFKNGGGNVMFVTNKETGDRVSYLHLKSYGVKAGTVVNPGDVIAESGDTAWTNKTTTPHIHIGVKQNGKYVDPITYINNISNEVTTDMLPSEHSEVSTSIETNVMQSTSKIYPAPSPSSNSNYITAKKFEDVISNVSTAIEQSNQLAVAANTQQTGTVLSARYKYNNRR